MMKSILFFLIFTLNAVAGNGPEPLGSYNKGSLFNAAQLPEEGEGFMHLFRESDLAWGTEEMLNLIQNSAAHMHQLFPDQGRLQVEDLSAKYGGSIEGHSSHQNGLDVDLTYYRRDGLEHDPVSTGRMYSDPMVINGKISPNFDLQKNWEFVKALHRYGRINRIFMDVVIKNELCSYARSLNEFNANINVLRSIRHEKNHQDHMHVRLNCPATAKKCISGPQLPAGSGC